MEADRAEVIFKAHWLWREVTMRARKLLVAAVSLVMVLAIPPSPAYAANLAWAPATGVNLQNDVNEAAVVEVRGHIVYTKGAVSPPYPPGWFVYAWNTHDDGVCGNIWCDPGHTVFYARLKMISGAGNLADGKDVAFWWDQRVYFGTGSFLNRHTPPEGLVFEEDGYTYDTSWSGGASGATSNQGVSYQIGVWQGGQNAWSSSTSTGAF
jgi:hypothetical protein